MLDLPHLGAALYVPASRPDLGDIAAGQKLANLRALIFCTEDAIAPHELAPALDNLARALRRLTPRPGRYRFVRIRDPLTLRTLLTLPGAEHLDGIVLPKVTAGNIDGYMEILTRHDNAPRWVMPTLETREVFSDEAMHALLRQLDGAPWRERVLTLRIGGNDLLALLKMRRPRHCTIYQTPIGQIIARLATTFIPYGFALSAPVFERLDDTATLCHEIESDLNHGLTGKTAIHPAQVALIEAHYRVQPQDMEAAQRILAPDAAGVFQLHQAMCEPATHRPWARAVLRAAQDFGQACPDQGHVR